MGTATFEVLVAFLRLGLTSFGGPVAHVGYFRADFVARRRWLDERAFADLVALCQFLPGPASSQLGMAIGLRRAGLLGAIAAWAGFTAPSAAAMIGCAYGLATVRGPAGWLHGLQIVALAVIAAAVLGMARAMCPDPPRIAVAVAAALLATAVPGVAGQMGTIAFGAVVGRLVLGRIPAPPTGPASVSCRLSTVGATAALAGFAVLLIGLPALAGWTRSETVAAASGFYRTGALVFGGGHVVLPLLQRLVVPSGWVPENVFLAGYGAAQAMPGPLFTFAGFLGTAIGGWATGLLCLLAIFLPGFLLLAGALPFWDALRRGLAVQAALLGVNASVVGLLAAGLWFAVRTGGAITPADLLLAVASFLLLAVGKVPTPFVVAFGAVAGGVLG